MHTLISLVSTAVLIAASANAAGAQPKLDATLKGHTLGVWTVAFDAQSETLASGSHDGAVRLWDSATGKNTAVLKAYASHVRCVAFSPDGLTLATSNGYRRTAIIKLWNVRMRKNTATLRGHTHGVSCVAFSPDGKRLASASFDATVRIWNVATRKTIASGSDDGTCKLWDVATGKSTSTWKAHTGAVFATAFSPQDEKLATTGMDKTVKLWNLPSPPRNPR